MQSLGCIAVAFHLNMKRRCLLAIRITSGSSKSVTGICDISENEEIVMIFSYF